MHALGMRGGTLALLVGAFAFLYLHVFNLPATPMWFDSDESLTTANALRMMRGEVMYRDFSHHVTPGAEAFYVAMFTLFGPRLWVSNALAIAEGLSLVTLAVVLSRALLDGWRALIPGLLFLTFGLRFALGLMPQHWLSGAAVLAAVAVIMRGRTPSRVVAAAALCGLTVFFNQPRGVLAIVGLAGFLAWDHRRGRGISSSLARTEAGVFATFVATAALTTGYFVWRGGLGPFLDNTIVFNATTYLSGWSIPTVYQLMPGLVSTTPWAWFRLPSHVAFWFMQLFPLVYLIFFGRLAWARSAGGRAHETEDRPLLLALVGALQFVGVAYNPDVNRLASVAIPALILVVWYLRGRRPLARLTLVALSLAGIGIGIVAPVRVQMTPGVSVDTPAGRMIVDPSNYPKYQWAREHTCPGDFLFEAAWPELYFPLQLRSPVPAAYVNVTWSREQDVRKALAGLERHQPRFVLWHTQLDGFDPDPVIGDSLTPLRAYLRSAYRPITVFPEGEQVWERKDTTSGRRAADGGARAEGPACVRAAP